MKLFDVYPLIDVTPAKAEGSYFWDENGTVISRFIWRSRRDFHWTFSSNLCKIHYRTTQ